MVRLNIPKVSGIYKIESIVNGKIYVGSAVDLKKRKNEHFGSLIKNKHVNDYFQNHTNKYGLHDLEFHIIEFCEKENLIVREQYYIDTLHLFDENKKPLGFNISPTAGSNLNIHWSEETKQNMSKAQLKRFEDPKEREYLSKVHIGIQAGEKHPMYGKHHSEESNQKNRITKNKFYQTEEGKKAIEKSKEIGKKIMGGYAERKRRGFDRTGEQAWNKGLTKETNVSLKNLSLSRMGEGNPMFGKQQSAETIAKKVGKTTGQVRLHINQYTLGGVFIKTYHGNKDLSQTGVALSNIYKCVMGQRNKAGGFVWKKAA